MAGTPSAGLHEVEHVIDTRWKRRFSILPVVVVYASLKAYPINPSFGRGWIPESAMMLEIENDAFSSCRKVCGWPWFALYIPMRLIGKGLFKDCSSLISVGLP
eukprot:scaffold8814_cov54-Cylindrotheca_fusiformis.AAC.1